MSRTINPEYRSIQERPTVPASTLKRAEGVIGVADANSQTLSAGKAAGFMGTEVDVNAEFWQLSKSRRIKVHKSRDLCVGWYLDLTVSFKIFRDERKIVNEAEVFLLPEEVSVFTQALIRHPISFPINYSQSLSMECGIHCIRLRSQEPFRDFAERLSDALCRLRS